MIQGDKTTDIKKGEKFSIIFNKKLCQNKKRALAARR